jgi:hypothetical protein
MGFTGDSAPIEGDVIPNRYIVALKPFLNSEEVEIHCSEIQGLYNQQPSVSAGLSSVGGSFSTFYIGHTNPPGASLTDTGPETFRGYSGTFLPETLQRIKNSNEVRYHPLTLPSAICHQCSLTSVQSACIAISLSFFLHYVCPSVSQTYPQIVRPFASTASSSALVVCAANFVVSGSCRSTQIFLSETSSSLKSST